MSADIEVRDGVFWSAQNWLFEWVLEDVMSAAKDPGLSATLREIVEENLAWLSISDLPPDQRAKFVQTVRTGLVDRANSELRPDMPARAKVLDRLADLAGALSERWPDA